MDTKQGGDGAKRRPPNAGKGRPKGTQNKLTRSVKEAFQVAFEQLQGDKNASLPVWARENPTEFYKLAAKLIPAEINGHVTHTLDLGVLTKPE